MKHYLISAAVRNSHNLVFTAKHPLASVVARDLKQAVKAYIHSIEIQNGKKPTHPSVRYPDQANQANLELLVYNETGEPIRIYRMITSIRAIHNKELEYDPQPELSEMR